MELCMESVLLFKSLGDFLSQITLETDINIPDSKPDVDEVILHKGSLLLDSVRQLSGKAEVTGGLQVEILYKCQGEGPSQENITIKLPVNDYVDTPGVEPSDSVTPRFEVEDLKVRVKNSRKLSLSCLINVYLECGRPETQKLPTGIEEASCPGLEAECEHRELEVLSMEVRKRDTCHIHEEVELGQNKPNIGRLLWKELSVNGLCFRLEEEKIRINGELVLFAMYQGEEEHVPVSWLEKSVSFNEELPCPQADFGMIQDIFVNICQTDVTIKPDYDGENRIFALDAVLELSIQLYSERKLCILSDAYSPVKELLIKRNAASLPKLLMKNNGKCRVAEKVSLPEDAGCLQICSSTCQVHIDTVSPGEDLLVEGAISVFIIYMSSDDARPIKSLEASIPFSQSLEVKGIHPGIRFNIRPQAEQLSTVMLSGSEIEVRAMIDLDAIVFEDNEECIITAIEDREYDQTVIDAMPAIIGYVVKEGDSLWSVAKQFYTGIDRLKKYNDIQSDSIKPGDKLLIVKEGQL